jgi:predicted DNA-binding antitoxin AbrB/MazE fold protein
MDMSQQIDATYDSGVLRPLEPLTLPDQARGKLTIEPESAPQATDKLLRQKAALLARWRELDQLPQHENKDGWSVRRHDEVLYGER